MWTFEYFPTGRLRSATDYSGRKSTFSYDTGGHLSKVNFPASGANPSGRKFELQYHGGHTYFVSSKEILVHNDHCTPVNHGTSRAPRQGTPNSIYEQLDDAGNVRSRTFYDENGRRFSRQDFDHSHGGMQPHEHNFGYNARGQRNQRSVGPVPPGYSTAPTR